MEAPQNLNELRIACEYRLLCRMLRAGGVASVIFGLLALARGASATESNPLAAALTLIGVFMVGEGAWILAVPRPSGMILEGLVFVVAGLWNLFISAAGGNSSLLFLAILQFVWGVKYFRRYSRFSTLPPEKPSKPTLDWLDQNIKSLAQGNSSDSSDTIEFQSAPPWRARLFPHAAMFVRNGGREVLLLDKNDVRLQQGPYDGKAVKVSVQLGKHNLNGRISPRSLARLLAWCSATS